MVSCSNHKSRDVTQPQEKMISPQWGNTMVMEVIPEAREMLAYLLNHEDQMSEWEQNFVSNMTYWLKVRKKEPDQIQLMMLSVIYNKIKKID
jgi:hypothetical protein